MTDSDAISENEDHHEDLTEMVELADVISVDEEATVVLHENTGLRHLNEEGYTTGWAVKDGKKFGVKVVVNRE